MNRIFCVQNRMEKNISMRSLKDYENVIKPYYVKEIVPYVVERKLFKPEDVGRLGTSAEHSGMGKMRAKTSFGKYIVDFFNNATIHGLKHLAVPHRHFCERIFTTMFLGIALTCVIVLSLSYWIQYQRYPESIVVDVDYKKFNITKPAITVCLLDRIAEEKFPEVFKKFGVEDTEEARKFFLFISKPMYETLNQTPIYDGTPPNKWLEILRDLYVGVGMKACTYSICSDPDVSNIVVVTERGICTSLHGRYIQYASVEYWFANNWTVLPEAENLPAYTYIYRDERISYNSMPKPYEFILHHPNELPRSDEVWYRITRSGIAHIKIDVQQIESSEAVRKLSNTQRSCNFPEHEKLDLWPVYTRNMCLMECRYNFIKSRCGCSPYFFRPIQDIPICNAVQLHCVGDLAASIISLMDNGVYVCDFCPDNCDTADYAIITFSQNDYKTESTKYRSDLAFNLDVQFPYSKLSRQVFFGFNEFLVGGAAGLFLGASIISFIEILYYVTLRLFWLIIKNRQHEIK